MSIRTIKTKPFTDQKPGTSGLRKSVTQFSQQHYLENFTQALFNTLATNNAADNKTNKTANNLKLALGGDGRYYNTTAIQIILRMAMANGVKQIMLGKNGLLSTPAASAVIRKYQLDGGIILSASHNPGGPDGDFGIKYNEDNGGPAREAVTDSIYQKTLDITNYRISDTEDIDLNSTGKQIIGGMEVIIFDSIDDYSEMMQSLFDFDQIQDHFREEKLEIAFDAMHAVTGPYANRILALLCKPESLHLLNTTPLPDFGKGHPDPSPAHARELMDIMYSGLPSGTTPIIGAASDGDGDRNMILGKQCFVSPSDSLAILTANATLIPAYAKGLTGVARSMPTSRAVDNVAKCLGIPCYETPTGWKFFGNLLDADKITLCGEESFGTGSNHIREKDGLWAVLFWINLIAARKQTVPEIVSDHWDKFGRNIYCRHDYEAIESTAANDIMQNLISNFRKIKQYSGNGKTVAQADEFSYTDPVDNSISEHQGIRIQFDDQSRIVYRLSGTGTQGATLRVYLETIESDKNLFNHEATKQLEPLGKLAAKIAEIEHFTGRDKPSVIV